MLSHHVLDLATEILGKVLDIGDLGPDHGPLRPTCSATSTDGGHRTANTSPTVRTELLRVSMLLMKRGEDTVVIDLRNGALRSRSEV